MAVYTASFRAATCDTTLGMAGLRSGTSTNTPVIREIRVFTEAANAAIIRIVRVTTAGTGTSITINEENEAKTPALATAVHSYSSTPPTIQAGDVDVGMVGAAIGSGFVYTFYGEGYGIFIPPAATNANGIMLVESAATANTYSGTFVWEE